MKNFITLLLAHLTNKVRDTLDENQPQTNILSLQQDIAERFIIFFVKNFVLHSQRKREENNNRTSNHDKSIPRCNYVCTSSQ